MTEVITPNQATAVSSAAPGTSSLNSAVHPVSARPSPKTISPHSDPKDTKESSKYTEKQDGLSLYNIPNVIHVS
jgi:hypothetical protein